MSDEQVAHIEALADALGPAVRRDASLAGLTTYGVGGPAALALTVRDGAHLAQIAEARVACGAKVPVLLVGLGSNLLVADEGFAGLVLVLGPAFAEVEITGARVRAGARAKLPVVARQSAGAGLRGFEWAAGVPGSIGGAVRMNAGVPGAEIGDHLVRVRVVDLASGEDGEMVTEELGLGYRRSALRADQVVVWAELELVPGDAADARALIKEKTQWRRDHQPGGRNAGSVFTNPEGDSAGRLIEAAGCKGLRIGSAEVSTKHANFIQVDDPGRAADVWALMDEVRRRVHAAHGVDLHPETVLVGLPPLPPLDGGSVTSR